MRFASSTLLIFLALFATAQAPSPANPESKKSDIPTKRLFVADYVISGAVGSAQTGLKREYLRKCGSKKNGDAVYVLSKLRLHFMA